MEREAAREMATDIRCRRMAYEELRERTAVWFAMWRARPELRNAHGTVNFNNRED